MNERPRDKAPKPYGLICQAISNWSHAGASTLSVAESESRRWDRPEIVTFFRRLGGIPKAWPDGKVADLASNAAVGEAVSAKGEDDTLAALQHFCSDDGDGVCGAAPRCADCPVVRHCDYPDRRLTIKDLPESERPRERLLAAGEGQLSDVELLAIIIGGGSERGTAVDLAARLLTTFGSFRRLARCTTGELTRIHGIGPAKAARIQAAFGIARRYATERLSPGTAVTGARQLFAYMREKLYGFKKEHFYSLMLDTKHCIIREEQIAVGSLSESIVHPREVFKAAIRESAAKVIFVHNHPSGNPEPSAQDRRLTARLCETGQLVGIEVLDHLIIGDQTYFSFAEQGLLHARRADE